jgi:hypothetical protein
MTENGLLKDISGNADKGYSVVTASYLPTADDVERFVEATQDTNPIHKRHATYGEAIVPGFMHSCAALLLIDKAMGLHRTQLLDYAHSDNHASMQSPVVSGSEYIFEVRFDPQKHEATAVLLDKKNKPVYELRRQMDRGRKNGLKPVVDNRQLVHTGQFSLEGRIGPLDFARIIGSDNPQRYFCALAGASSIVCQAIRAGKLDLDEGIVPLYTQQNFEADTAPPIDLRRGVSLELYLSNPEKFGALSAKGETMDMEVIARNDRGEVLYVLHAPLSFQQERLVDIVVRRAVPARKD